MSMGAQDSSSDDFGKHLADALADASLTILVRTCKDRVSRASRAELEAACAAMREKSKTVIKQLIENLRESPWLEKMALLSAATELADAGISRLVLEQDRRQDPANRPM